MNFSEIEKLSLCFAGFQGQKSDSMTNGRASSVVNLSEDEFSVGRQVSPLNLENPTVGKFTICLLKIFESRLFVENPTAPKFSFFGFLTRKQ